MVLDLDSTSLWWQRMDRGERVQTLKELGFPTELAKYDWDWLSDDEQREIARYRVLSVLGMVEVAR